MSEYKKYCTGCGLCQALGKAELYPDKKGFFHPNTDTGIRGICPVSGVQCAAFDKTKIWGRNEGVFIGWSNDASLRKKASSGGTISQVLCYLLENQLVDGVIHIGADEKKPTKTVACISQTIEEVKERCGSRYAISSPLLIMNQIDPGKRYAFVGKPCDVVALRNYLKKSPEMKKAIRYLLSFFCMGVPSEQAQEKLLAKLGCSNCRTLTYRGNGWPGFTVATDGIGNTTQMDYASSWGNILGRDLMAACKYCLDGIGEMADISCGDAWYLTEDKKPDFHEHDGRNVIFARTEVGLELLNKMRNSGAIHLEEYDNYAEELPLIQTSQYNRRRQMLARIIALRVFGKSTPEYPLDVLKAFASGMKSKEFFRAFVGSCKRLWKEESASFSKKQ